MIEYHLHYQEQQSKYYLLLLSLLLHACIAFIFIFFEFNNDANRPFYITPREPEYQPSANDITNKSLSAAQLTARSSNFGAPLIFSDDLQIPTTPEKSEEDSLHSEQIESAKIAELPKQLSLPETKTMQKITAAIERENKPTKKTQRKKQKQTPTEPSTGPLKKPLTFADLAAGFLQTIHQNRTEGNAFVSRAGNPNLKPDELDIKYSSYMAKFNWYVENSSRLHPFHPNPPIAQDTYLRLLITLDKEGRISNFTIVQSSGRVDLDSHIEKIIKKAAPFPDLPDHFNTPVFTFPMVINIGKTPSGVHNGEYIFASH